LSDGGILASVGELADASKVPLRLDVRPLGRLPEAVEAAAYRVVADCVRAAERAGNSRAVSVVVETRGSALGVCLCLPGVTAVAARRALLHAADRVIAVGGNLRVTSRSGDTVVEVSLPCAS
jgi:signal transduction histidine kinase